MMKITFKDVGQGDSIIIEWIVGGRGKIGIIDCNLKGRKNPVLDHIIAKRTEEIEFIILSHPHRDHYSGMSGLFNYIEEKGIIVHKLAHTLLSAEKRYWKYFEVNSDDTRTLSKLIKRFKILLDSGVIKVIDILVKGVPLKIDEDIALECLAPSHNEVEEYHKIVKDDADANIKEASSAANLLSTIFRLKVGDSYFLFTSDAEVMAFDNIISRGEFKFDGQKFVLCQIPHHGSENNHHPDFWDKIELSSGETYAAISAGQHRLYNHPSFDVIKHFHNKGYVVHCTSIINGMEEYAEYLKDNIIRSSILDGASVIAPEYMESNDRVFLFKDNKLIFQPTLINRAN